MKTDGEPENKIEEAQNELVKEQSPPIPNEEDAVWDLVIKDMNERDLEGLRKYGTRLQAYNGRNPSIDAYQEALDLVVYLRQGIIERNQLVKCLKAVVDFAEKVTTEPSFTEVFISAHRQGVVYKGPQLKDEIENAKALLERIGEK